LHAPHIAVGQLRAEQHQLPLAGGLLPRPQDKRLHAGQRQADGQLGLARVFLLQLLSGHHHGRFGGAVGVEEAHIGAALALPLGQLLGVDRLAADDDGGQIGRDMGLTRRQRHHPLVPERGGQVEVGDPHLLHPGRKGGHGFQQGVGAQHQGGASAQGGEHLLDAGVEVEGGELQHPRVFIQVITAAGRSGEVIQRAVADRHPLGQTGRARGEHQVGDGAAGGRLVQAVIAHQIPRQKIPNQESTPLKQAGQLVTVLGLGDQGLDLPQPQNMALTLQRLLRVERHVDGAGQQHRQLGEDGLGGAGQHDPHLVAGGDACGLQGSCHLFGSGQQHLVAEAGLSLLRALNQGDLVRGLGGEVAERIQHRPRLDHFMSGAGDQGAGPLLRQPVGLERPQGLGGLGQPAAQQGKQGIGDGGQIPLLVAAGVSVQIQAWLAIDANLHLDGEILHRAGADVENMGR